MNNALTLARLAAHVATLHAAQPIGLQLGLLTFPALEVLGEHDQIVLRPCPASHGIQTAAELTEALRQRLAGRGGETPVLAALPSGALLSSCALIATAHGRAWLVFPDTRPATVFEQVGQLFRRRAA